MYLFLDDIGGLSTFILVWAQQRQIQRGCPLLFLQKQMVHPLNFCKVLARTPSIENSLIHPCVQPKGLNIRPQHTDCCQRFLSNLRRLELKLDLILGLITELFTNQARSQDWIWGGAEPPKSGPFGPKKWTFWTSPPQPSYKKPILAHFVAKSGPFARFGGCCTPPAMGLVCTQV